MGKKRKRRGWYCRICGRYRSNESFTGKGRKKHICKDCAKLSGAEQASNAAVNKIINLPFSLSKDQIKWLRKKAHDSRPDVREAAEMELEMRFGTNNEPEIPDYDDDFLFDDDFF